MPNLEDLPMHPGAKVADTSLLPPGFPLSPPEVLEEVRDEHLSVFGTFEPPTDDELQVLAAIREWTIYGSEHTWPTFWEQPTKKRRRVMRRLARRVLEFDKWEAEAQQVEEMPLHPNIRLIEDIEWAEPF